MVRAQVGLAIRRTGEARRRTARSERSHPLLDLQRTAGNAAVAGLVVQRAPAGAHTEMGFAEKEFRAAEAAYRAKDWETARTHFLSCYVDAPPAAQPDVAFNLAQCDRSLKRWGEAVTWYEEYLAAGRPERRADALDFLRECRTNAASDKGEAIARPKGSGEEGTFAEQEFRAAEAAYQAKDWQTARTHFLASYGAAPRAAQEAIAFNVGQCDRMASRWAEAIDWYEEYLAGGDKARRSDAMQALRECRVAAAGAEGEKLAKPPKEGTDMGFAETEFRQGETAFRQRDFESARTHFLAAYGAVDQRLQPPIAFSIAQSCRPAGRYREALGYYKEYLATGDGNRRDDALAGMRECHDALAAEAGEKLVKKE